MMAMINGGWALFATLIIGLLAGGIGSIVGVGGGFIAIPAMSLFLSLPPQVIIGASLTMVFFNALSGSVAFYRQKRIDFPSGWKFALATFPGAVLGSRAADCFTSRSFDVTFGFFLILVALLMWLRKGSDRSTAATVPAEIDPVDLLADDLLTAKFPWGVVRRKITDVCGVQYSYAFNLPLGILFSFLVGFISSILGIGGGIIHVPFLIMVLGFPPHVATATSLFVLTWTSLVGAVTHFWLGHVDVRLAAFLSIGGIIGAQGGARISMHLSGAGIVKVFAVVLVLAGCRMILG